jgi:hypothetical protein
MQFFMLRVLKAEVICRPFWTRFLCTYSVEQQDYSTLSVNRNFKVSPSIRCVFLGAFLSLTRSVFRLRVLVSLHN